MKFNKIKEIAPIALSFSLLLASLSGCAPADRNRTVPPGNAVTPAPGQNMTAPGVNPIGTPGDNPMATPGINPVATPGTDNGATPGTNPYANRYGWVGVTPGPNMAPPDTPNVGMQDNRQRAENIKNQLNTNNMYDRLNVIVVDNMALVGYNPATVTADIQATNRAITDRVKQIDPGIANVAVSGAADMAARINQLGIDITNNRNMNEVRTEVNRLMQQIAPTLR